MYGRIPRRDHTDAPAAVVNGHAEAVLAGNLFVNDWNPNELTAEEEEQLTYEIKRFGFLVPLIVRRHPGDYGDWARQIIDGEHRYAVGIRLGMDEFPCWVIEATDDDAMQLTPILNELHGNPNSDKLGILLRDLMERQPETELRIAMPFSRARFDELIGEKTVDWGALEQKRAGMDQAATERWVERVYRMPADAAAVVDQAVERGRKWMDQTTGRDSSLSPPSFSDAEHNHSDHHFTLTVFPDGKVALTTPDTLEASEFVRVGKLLKSWLDGDTDALLIGNCQVVAAAARPVEGTVERRAAP